MILLNNIIIPCWFFNINLPTSSSQGEDLFSIYFDEILAVLLWVILLWKNRKKTTFFQSAVSRWIPISMTAVILHFIAERMKNITQVIKKFYLPSVMRKLVSNFRQSVFYLFKYLSNYATIKVQILNIFFYGYYKYNSKISLHSVQYLTR